MEDNQLVHHKKSRYTLSYGRRAFGLSTKEEGVVTRNQRSWFLVKEDIKSTYEDLILLLHDEADDHEDDSSSSPSSDVEDDDDKDLLILQLDEHINLQLQQLLCHEAFDCQMMTADARMTSIIINPPKIHRVIDEHIILPSLCIHY